VFIARAMCGIECKSRRLVFEEQSASFSKCDQQLCTKLDDHCLWRDPISRVLNSIQFICISISLLMLNKLLYTWCADYCKCVRPAELPVLTEVRAPSLWEQHPWYIPHLDRPEYNSVHSQNFNIYYIEWGFLYVYFYPQTIQHSPGTSAL
jgi:hypothetical protein